MNETVELENPEYGFTWYRVEGQYYLQAEDGGFRRVNESVIDLLKRVARGELTVAELRTQIEGGQAVVEETETTAEEVLSLVETYIDVGVLREDAPVVRVTPPDDIQLWPRVGIFLALFAVFGFVVAPITSSVTISTIAQASVWEIISIVVLSFVFIGIHEYGHHSVSARHFDPSVRIDFVNGVVPAVITDTTGSWTLPRNRRIWINLAGPVLELVAAVPLVALYYVFPSNLVVQGLLLAVFGHVVFALNPLVHGDGFWILCDFFGLRNVRQRGIEDLTALRPSWSATYVVVSYGFGAVVAISIVATLVVLSGVAELPGLF